MKKSIKLLCFFSIVFCVFWVMTTSVSATEIANGTCGESLTWVLDDNGTLTISGTGEMYDYDDFFPYLGMIVGHI